MVSRRNCKISAQGGRWYVEDLGSANGTYVTTGSGPERRITREPLVHGDIIRCGSLQVRFVEVADAQAQPQRPSRPTPPATLAPGPDAPVDPDAPKPVGNAGATNPSRPPNGGVDVSMRKTSLSGGEELGKLKDDYKKCVEELETAKNALKSAKEEREQSLAKIDAMEAEQKRLRSESSSAKDALDKLGRQAKKDKDELVEQRRIAEELRQDIKQLREQNAKFLSQLEDQKTASDAKDRQLASAGEDMRRSKKEVESLNAQLHKLMRERDEQIRNINSQTGDVDRLRDILKEREKIMEEQRVGLVNQEVQIKDLRKRTEELERELVEIKGKHDNLRDRYSRAQAQIEEMHQLLSGQQQGNDKLLQLTQENRTLRQDLQAAELELATQSELLRKAKLELGELTKERNRILEEKKTATLASEQSLAAALEKANAGFKAELKKYGEERDVLAKDRDELRSLAARSEQAALQAQTELATAIKECEQYKARIRDLEAQWRSANAVTQGISLANESAMQLAELKAVAAAAYDGISDSFSNLRKNLSDLEESCRLVESALSEKEATKKLLLSLEEVQNCFDEARSQIRSLRTVIE